MTVQSIISDLQTIILESRDYAIRAVDQQRTLMYWQIGKRIFEEEQYGKGRADYGDYLTTYIADQLEPQFGSGFSKRQIELFRQFYRIYPIANTLYSQLSWSQYKILIRLDTQDKKTFISQKLLKIIGPFVNWSDKFTVVSGSDY